MLKFKLVIMLETFFFVQLMLETKYYIFRYFKTVGNYVR